MRVEMYIGYTDHTWDTIVVEIPDNTHETDIEERANAKLRSILEQMGKDYPDVQCAFTGIYHIDMPDEEDEDFE